MVDPLGTSGSNPTGKRRKPLKKRSKAKINEITSSPPSLDTVEVET